MELRIFKYQSNTISNHCATSGYILILYWLAWKYQIYLSKNKQIMLCFTIFINHFKVWQLLKVISFHWIKRNWKSSSCFPSHWPFMCGIHRSPVNSPRKGQWSGALMFSLICARTNGWVNNRDAGDLRCHCVHYVVTVMKSVLGWIHVY